MNNYAVRMMELEMETDCINRNVAIHEIIVGQWIEKIIKNQCTVRDMIAAIPAADVRPVAEISNAVDEVLDFLNDNSNCMPYHIYSALFDLVSGICHNCGADMREVKTNEK